MSVDDWQVCGGESGCRVLPEWLKAKLLAGDYETAETTSMCAKPGREGLEQGCVDAALVAEVPVYAEANLNVALLVGAAVG